MELVFMDVPAGRSVSRVVKTLPLTFPSSVETFVSDMIPLMELVWKAKEKMKDTMMIINKRKQTVRFKQPDDRVAFQSSFRRSN